jgi:hypothetical protein
VDPQDGQDATVGIRDVRICGSRLVLRALRPREIDEEWHAMVTADPMVIADLPDEASFKAAEVAEARTDPANVAMRTVFQRVGWKLAGSLTEFGREWVIYRITRLEWEAR